MQAEIYNLAQQTSRARRRNTTVLMAGGFGSRLGELTRQVPKPLIPVAGQPMLERIIHRMRGFGLHNYVLTTHYLPEKIHAHCGDGSDWGVHIRYAHEAAPLGTAGGLSLIGPVTDAPVLVCNADILTEIDFPTLLEAHDSMDADFTVVTVPHHVAVPYGVIETEPCGEIRSVEEKPTYSYRVSAGTYVINPHLFSLIRPNERIDMPQLMDRAKATGFRVCAYEYDGYWIDVGRPADLKKACEYLEPSELTG
ncbi:MAG: NTP transferase domain-containing protein [Brevundimonas sp.]|jgi:NDP-sugar pyrophosphorylase family protein|uniref:Sugar phosphate nucleotidyltransferase n=1 Tax=Brevundimonas olei TaxID=657642 RepID=A0ABZ2IAC1_9CAUL|nr:sugar phosphate nucleotidyltransferase [Brevundimonas sp.]MCH4269917.1 NTP transferase domain-containing protein [Brevundimonas sp.]